MNDNDIVRRTDIINRLLDRSKPLQGLIHVDDVIRIINVAPSVKPQEPKQTASEILKEISDELERIMYEHGGVDPYEMGITVGLSMARVAISNRRLDLEGIPK